MPQMVIGIIGENGAGKGTLIKMLCEELGEGCAVLSTGRILLQTLASWHVPPTRANMQLLPVVMEQAYGIGALARVMSADIAQSQERIVFYDAVRWLSDVQAVRRSEQRNILVYVTAEKQLRYERLRLRRQKAGEEYMTWEQFIAEEEAATEIMIPVLARGADTVISNNGNEANLRMQVRALRDTIQAALA